MQSTIHPSAIPQFRQWRGHALSLVEEALSFRDSGTSAWAAIQRLVERLQLSQIDYVVLGQLATAMHGCCSVLPTIDLCVWQEDLERFRREFVGSVYQAVEGRSRRFYDPQSQETFDFLVSGELAGRPSGNKVITFPDPSEAVEIEELRTVTLSRLIELKLVTRRLKDWADVVAMIRANKLDEGFADQLNPLVRMAYLECYDHKVEEDKYDRERD